MRLALICLATAGLSAQPSFQIPTEIKQGFTLHIEASGAESGRLIAEFLGKKVPLYSNGNGVHGLMPVSVMQTPGDFPLIIRTASGKKLHESVVKVLDGQYLEQNIATTRRMRGLRTSDEEIKRMAAFRAAIGSTKLWDEPLSRPVPECTNSPFGVKRMHDGKLTGNFHAGLDFRSPPNRAIKAAADGVVRVARMFPRQGGTVGLDHGQGLQTTYIHMSRVAAIEGRAVKRGQVIGYVGSTGFATGPHLHWSVHVHGIPVNPLQWISGAEPCQPH